MKKTQKEYLNNIIRGIGKRLSGSTRSQKKKAGLTWLKEKQLKHMPYNEPHVYTLNGKKIHYNNGPEILHSLKEIFVEEVYLTRFDTDTPKILDCGANIGLSVLYFKSKYPGANIIAFEPDPTNFTLLKKNIEGNNLHNVELRNEAVWKDNTTIEFVSDGTLGSKIGSTSSGSNVIRMNATRLRDYLDEKIDFLKLDIEGAEYEVLKDCKDKLGSIQYLFIEFHGFFDRMYELTDIFSMVQENGFSYYIKEATNVYPTPFYRNQNKRPYDLQLNVFCIRNVAKK
jgi:FkbM family methyltransferase